MDKVVSARLDSRIVEKLERASKRLGMTKRRFLETAIEEKADAAERASEERRARVKQALDATAGMWNDRTETTEELIQSVRDSMMRALNRNRLDRDEPAT